MKACVRVVRVASGRGHAWSRYCTTLVKVNKIIVRG